MQWFINILVILILICFLASAHFSCMIAAASISSTRLYVCVPSIIFLIMSCDSRDSEIKGILIIIIINNFLLVPKNSLIMIKNANHAICNVSDSYLFLWSIQKALKLL